jgi:hypothetical protein
MVLGKDGKGARCGLPTRRVSPLCVFLSFVLKDPLQVGLR